MHDKSIQSCPALSDPMDHSQPGSLSLEFSRQKYWSELPCPPPVDLPDPGIESVSLMSPALAEGSLPLTSHGKPNLCIHIFTHVISCVTFEYPSMCCVLCWVTQSCPKICDPWTVARQGLLSLGILQARILEWVAMPSPRGSSQPRGWIQVSHIAGGSFTILATWETHMFITVTAFVLKWLLLFLPILLLILLLFSYFIVEISKVYSRDYNQKLCLAS